MPYYFVDTYSFLFVFLHDFVDSSVFVEVTTADTPIIEQTLILQCSATTVRGITDRVDIIWTTGTMEVRKVIDVLPNDFNSLSIYNDSFIIPSLDINDIGSVYQCKVIVNSFPVVAFKDTFTIPLPGMNTNTL